MFKSVQPKGRRGHRREGKLGGKIHRVFVYVMSLVGSLTKSFERCRVNLVL